MLIRVFLVDDQELVRRGVRDLLEGTGDIVVVGEAGTGRDARTRLRTSPADVVILEARLPDEGAPALIRALRAEQARTAFLVLAGSDDDADRIRAVGAGASGYVLKQVRSQDLVDSIRRVARGESLLDHGTTARVLSHLRERDREEERLHELTRQELRVLDLLGEGLTNRRIADSMHLSEKTVKNYVSSVLRKLGMARRTEAALFAAARVGREGRQGCQGGATGNDLR